MKIPAREGRGEASGGCMRLGREAGSLQGQTAGGGVAYLDGAASGCGGRSPANLETPFPATIGRGEAGYGILGFWIGGSRAWWEVARCNDGESSKLNAAAASSSSAN